MSDVYRTAHKELTIETENSEYRVIYLPDYKLVVLPPNLWTNKELKSTIKSSSLVDNIENHEAVSLISHR